MALLCHPLIPLVGPFQLWCFPYIIFIGFPIFIHCTHMQLKLWLCIPLLTFPDILLELVCDQQLLTWNLILSICLKYVLFTFSNFCLFLNTIPFLLKLWLWFSSFSLAFYVFKKLCLCLLFKWLFNLNIWSMYSSKAIIPCNKDFIAILCLLAKVGLLVFLDD